MELPTHSAADCLQLSGFKVCFPPVADNVRQGLDFDPRTSDHGRMDERQREHVRRIVTQSFASSRAAMALQLEALLSEFIQAGRSGGGMAIVAAGEKLSRATEILVGELATKIASVSRSPLAYEELASAMRRWLRICQDDLAAFGNRTNGVRLQERGTLPSLAAAEIAKIQQSVDLRLAVEEMELSVTPPPVAAPPLASAKKGGRPPSEFWDDMWAAIAVQLYSGSLTPKTQADVARAMADWIEANGHEAADSTVKGRARRLWDAIVASE